MRSTTMLRITLAACILAGASGCSEDAPPAGTTTPPPKEDAGPEDAGPPGIELVGHSDLGARGMNSALAVAGNFVYVGSRTEGETHADTGVMIVDVSDPTKPTVVGQIGPPDEALLGLSSRELRAVPDKDLLVVMNFSCSPQIHACSRNLSKFPATGGGAETDNLKLYDIADRAHPKLVGTYDFGSYSGKETVKPHEMFLWRDPKSPDRILLYVTTPAGPPALQVLDLSNPASVKVVATWDAVADGGLTETPPAAIAHSISVSDDGTIGYLSYLSAGFFAVDTSDIANGAAAPKIKALTPIDKRVDYVPPETVGTHSAVAVPGRALVILTDEVYPPPLQSGCPWGWARLVDVTDLAQPVIASEYRIEQNKLENCPDDKGGPAATTFTAHNPTLTESLAFITWHSGGLQVVDTTDAASPVQLTAYMPEPLASVTVEDPSFKGNPVEMWSYPVISGGLVYVVDVRNGLYVLRYHGPHQDEVAKAGFREGNSNLH